MDYLGNRPMKFEKTADSDSSSMPASENVLKNYEDLSEIGQGSSGVVFKARDLANDGRFVAIKKFKVHLNDEGGVPASILREIGALRQLGLYGHNNVIKLLDICNGPRLEREKQLLLYIVFEHMEMDLAEYLEKCPPPGVPPERISHLMKQLLSGVDFLHTHRIIHRDLKPQNLLVNANGDLKIADFGLAKLYEERTAMTSVVVTLWYRAPEVLLGGSYATPLDLWSCGCVMAEMYLRGPLFKGETEVDQLKRIISVIGTPSESEWPIDTEITRKFCGVFPKLRFKEVIADLCDAGEELLDSLLKFNPTKRLNALEALNHRYFRDDLAAAALDVGPDQ